jgi:hypothetical protein
MYTVGSVHDSLIDNVRKNLSCAISIKRSHAVALSSGADFMTIQFSESPYEIPLPFSFLCLMKSDVVSYGEVTLHPTDEINNLCGS